MTWTIEYQNLQAFYRFLKKLDENHADYVRLMVSVTLKSNGPAICETNLGKALGNGLYEMRLRRNPGLLVRIFFCVEGNLVVILLAYDKKAHDSPTYQNEQIRKARSLMKHL